MLVTLSREGVVFLASMSSSHFTEIHVLPPPVSEANWRSLSRPGGLPPSLPKMASSFTGSAHLPFPGYNTDTTVWSTNKFMILKAKLVRTLDAIMTEVSRLQFYTVAMLAGVLVSICLILGKVQKRFKKVFVKNTRLCLPHWVTPQVHVIVNVIFICDINKEIFTQCSPLEVGKKGCISWFSCFILPGGGGYAD